METSVNQSGVPAFKQISTGLQALRTAEIKITFQQKKKKKCIKTLCGPERCGCCLEGEGGVSGIRRVRKHKRRNKQ